MIQLLYLFMMAAYRFFKWAFTKGWPVGLALMIAALFDTSGYHTFTWPMFFITLFSGYAFMYRESLFPKK